MSLACVGAPERTNFPIDSTPKDYSTCDVNKIFYLRGTNFYVYVFLVLMDFFRLFGMAVFFE